MATKVKAGTEGQKATRNTNDTKIEAIVRDVVTTIEREGNVKAIFGEPVELDTHRIVPVARAHVSIGGGGGFGSAAVEKLAEAAQRLLPAGGGGGGGIDVTIEPVGFICEQDGRVVFTTIAVTNGAETEAKKPTRKGW